MNGRWVCAAALLLSGCAPKTQYMRLDGVRAVDVARAAVERHPAFLEKTGGAPVMWESLGSDLREEGIPLLRDLRMPFATRWSHRGELLRATGPKGSAEVEIRVKASNNKWRIDGWELDGVEMSAGS